MGVIRSIAAVVVGWIVAVLVIIVVESTSGLLHPPPDGKSITEWAKEFEECTPAAKEWLRSMPTSALAMLQVGWGFGAFFGGGVAAWIAGRGRLIHAGIIGVLILAATIVNFFQMKAKLDYSHPDWLIATGLLLPVPLSLLGGWLVSLRYPSEPAPSAGPDGAIMEGDPPVRPN